MALCVGLSVVELGVRVKLYVSSERGVRLETSALVSSGFESGEPDIAMPIRLAIALKVWPTEDFEIEGFETAGGEVDLPRVGDGED